MTKRERLARMAGLVATLLPLAPAQAHGQQVAIPPDTVTTVFVADGVHRPSPGPVRLELAEGGS